MAIHNPPAGTDISGATREWRSSPARRVASLAPFALAFALPILSSSPFGPGYVDRLFNKPPDILGLPLGLVVAGIVLAWAALGALIVWTTSSRIAASLALAFITLPSMLAIIFAPAAILILQNLP